MNMHRPITQLGEQPHLLKHIENLDYSRESVVLVPPGPAQAIVDSLGWPSEPGLHILACKLEPGSGSAIHKDQTADGSAGLEWALNIPVKDCWGTWMEWYASKTTEADNYYTIANPVDGYAVPALKKSDAVFIESSKGCTTAYVAANSSWHRVVNVADRTSWCVSIRYYPLSYERMKLAAARTPWLARIVATGRP